MLEGSFSLSTMPDQVVFYLEGPSPGSDLLIKSVIITSPSSTEYEVSFLLFRKSSLYPYKTNGSPTYDLCWLFVYYNSLYYLFYNLNHSYLYSDRVLGKHPLVPMMRRSS